MEPLRLYWRPGTASMAPHAAIAEIGVEYELVRIERDEAQTDSGYLALNPLGVVPTLIDGDLVAYGRPSERRLRRELDRRYAARPIA